jgi:tRNA uridine 5-carboxymethylaminomethyl modification enzyme
MDNALPDQFDAIVVGGGHAGCEAAHALARLGQRTLLLTMSIDTIGAMSCNPAIGGLAKGHLVREIDALGGLMGRIADRAAIHRKRLNTRRGPAVRSSRAQSDMAVYRREMQRVMLGTPNLRVHQASVERLLLDTSGPRPRVAGVVDQFGAEWRARAVIITTGTFLRGLCHVGERRFSAGRAGDRASVGLAEQIAALGLDVGRLKTGTTPRLDARSIAWDGLEEQPGDAEPWAFSFFEPPGDLPQVSCFITYTNPHTHELIEAAKERSPMFNGTIEGIGPRYCPSIEDKVFRFRDRERHQIFLEPHGLDSGEIYPNGISTSLPWDVQVAMVRSIAGLENAVITRPGYAVEYDFVNPVQLAPTLELHAVAGLYLAGQINGTSGYEEAGAQGLMAGLNAGRALRGEAPLVLGRDEGYIGVMIDDLVTHGVTEPYRMFTSRAEFRLLLREDNADLRLSAIGRETGLLGDVDWATFCRRRDAVAALVAAAEATVVTPSGAAIDALARIGQSAPERPMSVARLVQRPDAALRDFVAFVPALADAPDDVVESAEVACKYAGYLERQRRDAVALRETAEVEVPADLDYGVVPGLSNEAREKLGRVRPASIAQAGRIPGLTPAAVTSLWMYVRARQSASAGSP